jgi:hypothetical protein
MTRFSRHPPEQTIWTVAADRETTAQRTHPTARERFAPMHSEPSRTGCHRMDTSRLLEPPDEIDERDALMIGRVALSALLMTSSAAAFEVEVAPDTPDAEDQFGLVTARARLMATVSSYEKDSPIYREDEPADNIYQVINGAARATKHLSDGPPPDWGFLFSRRYFRAELKY